MAREEAEPTVEDGFRLVDRGGAAIIEASEQRLVALPVGGLEQERGSRRGATVVEVLLRFRE
jgi:hypothetical protein